jgi:hypothetical protein
VGSSESPAFLMCLLKVSRRFWRATLTRFSSTSARGHGGPTPVEGIYPRTAAVGFGLDAGCFGQPDRSTFVKRLAEMQKVASVNKKPEFFFICSPGEEVKWRHKPCRSMASAGVGAGAGSKGQSSQIGTKAGQPD